MALVKCPECEKKLSDKARACPSCGHPMIKLPGVELPAVARASSAKKESGWLKWVFIVPAVLFALLMLVGKAADPDDAHAAEISEARKKECAAAMLSGIGHSTIGYTDKLEYEKVVREKCKGLSINGKAIGQ